VPDDLHAQMKQSMIDGDTEDAIEAVAAAKTILGVG
jgi:hypothetical protein